MTEKISAHDPRHRQALDDYKAQFGMAIEDVLLPTHWCVIMLDDKPVVCVNSAGLRALTLTAPRHDAQQVADEILAEVQRIHHGDVAG